MECCQWAVLLTILVLGSSNAAPFAPTNLHIYKSKPTSITIGWELKQTGDEPTFIIQYWEDGSRDFQVVRDVSDTQYTATGLKPTTMYQFTLLAVGADRTIGPWSRRLEATTADAESEPPSPSENQIRLTLNVSEPLRAGDYVRITCNADSDTTEHSWRWYRNDQIIPEEATNVLHLLLSKEYNSDMIICEAITVAARRRKELTLDVQYGPEFMESTSDLDQVTVTEYSEAIFTCEAEGNPAPHIQWRSQDSQEIISNSSHLFFPSVQQADYGVYICSALAPNFNEITKEFFLLQEIITTPQTSPRHLVAHALSSSTVVVSWEEPLDTKGLIYGYDVYYTSNPEAPIDEWTRQTVSDYTDTTLDNLLPSTTYTLSVVAVTHSGRGPFSEPLEVTTLNTIPEMPYGPPPVDSIALWRTSPTTMKIVWENPIVPVSGFRIYYNPVDVPNLSLWTVRDVGLYSMTVIGGLNPAVTYAVRMQSRDGDGNVGPISEAYVLPDYIEPDLAIPVNIHLQVRSVTALGVRWTTPVSRTLSTLKAYRLYYSMNSKKTTERILKGSSTSHTIMGILPGSTVVVQMTAIYEEGESAKSEPVTVRLPKFQPSPPRRVRVKRVSNSSISVSWRPGKKAFESVSSYAIRFVKIDETGNTLGDVQMEQTSSRNVTIITGLQPNTRYQFQVAAHTMWGMDIYSKAKTIRTKGGGRMKVVPMVPREIVLDMVQLSPLTLRATWKRPSRTYGALKGYKFSWGPQGEINKDYEIQGPANIFVAEVSDPGKVYEFHIAAKNRIGVGPSAIGIIDTSNMVGDTSGSGAPYR